jgi:hypothetical protein
MIEKGLSVELSVRIVETSYAALHTEQFHTAWRAEGQDLATFLLKCTRTAELELG